MARSPSALLLFFGEGSPTKREYTEKSGYPYSNLSNREDQMANLGGTSGALNCPELF